MSISKINPEIQSSLFSVDPGIVLATIQKIKEIGNKNYLPVLFDFLLTNPEENITKEILKLLGTVKDRETVSVFMDAINNDKYKPIRKMIIVACWQNGMDFSSYIETFVDIILDENWEIGFEAFTVIENFEYFPENETRSRTIEKINIGLESAQDQKVYFLNEILKLID